MENQVEQVDKQSPDKIRRQDAAVHVGLTDKSDELHPGSGDTVQAGALDRSSESSITDKDPSVTVSHSSKSKRHFTDEYTSENVSADDEPVEKKKSVSSVSCAVSSAMAGSALNVDKSKTAAKISISIGGNKPITQQSASKIAIKISPSAGQIKPANTAVLKKPVTTVKNVFNQDEESEEDEEEMPPEAKMRMRNIGRNTPTSAGPNSFNKGRLGFSDSQRLHERAVKELAKEQNN